MISVFRASVQDPTHGQAFAGAYDPILLLRYAPDSLTINVTKPGPKPLNPRIGTC